MPPSDSSSDLAQSEFVSMTVSARDVSESFSAASVLTGCSGLSSSALTKIEKKNYRQLWTIFEI